MRSHNIRRGLSVPTLAILILAGSNLRAQAPASNHFLGSITAISGNNLTVKTDQGDVHQFEVPSTAQLKRIAPGQTDLSKAETIDLSGLATGDRVLVNLDPNATGSTPQALRIIAIKQADVAKKQQAEAEAWNQGVHGLVKSIDATAGTIVVNVRQGAVTRQVSVTTTSSTSLKRYAPGSVRFDQAQPAPIAAIQTGDQLWARGAKSADGGSIAADGIVSGSFRSIPGTVLSTDTAASTVTVKDLVSKKPVTVHITADAQLRRLDDAIASRIAARLKGNGASARPAAAGGGGNGGGAPRPFSQGANGAGAGDLESILDRAPAIQLASLQKGEAVMIVATEDASGINAIKLLAGVEPLLEAPEAQDLLSSWSLNSGSPEAAE